MNDFIQNAEALRKQIANDPLKLELLAQIVSSVFRSGDLTDISIQYVGYASKAVLITKTKELLDELSITDKRVIITQICPTTRMGFIVKC